MNIVFLDYDGVVNTPMWNEDGTQCRYNFPSDHAVNNFQAVQWVSEFCQKYDYSIVVTSTWRMDDNYDICLFNGGLRPGICLRGRTKVLHGTRGEEIELYLKEHPEVTGYLIFDDEADLTEAQKDRLVKTNGDVGFAEYDFKHAVRLHKKFNSTK